MKKKTGDLKMEELVKKVEKLVTISENVREIGTSIVNDVEKIGLIPILKNFEKFNEFIPKIEENLQGMLSHASQTLDIVDKAGFNNIFDNAKNASEFMTMGQELAPEITPLIPRIWNLQTQALDAISEDEEVKDELEEVDDVSIEITVVEMDQSVTLQVIDQKLGLKLGAVPEPNLNVNIPISELGKLTSGDISDLMQAYMAGDVKVSGDLTKAMALRGVIEYLTDKIGFGA